MHKIGVRIIRVWTNGISRDKSEPKKNSPSISFSAGVWFHRNFSSSDIDHMYWQSHCSHFFLCGLYKTHTNLHLSCKLVHQTLPWSRGLPAEGSQPSFSNGINLNHYLWLSTFFPVHALIHLSLCCQWGEQDSVYSRWAPCLGLSNSWCSVHHDDHAAHCMIIF